MAKAGTRRRRRAARGAGTGAKTGAKTGSKPWAVPRGTMGLVATLAVVIAAAAWWMFNVGQQESDFQELAAAGDSALSGVTTVAGEGRGHLLPGQSVTYRSDPPTSGIHDPAWTAPGAHDAAQFPAQLVHALEHGNIVIYYDRPDEAVMQQLRVWAGLFRSQWSGIVLTPNPGIGKTIVLTAWRRLLRQRRFDAATAAAFIDRYRGRGPENRVR